MSEHASLPADALRGALLDVRGRAPLHGDAWLICGEVIAWLDDGCPGVRTAGLRARADCARASAAWLADADDMAGRDGPMSRERFACAVALRVLDLRGGA